MQMTDVYRKALNGTLTSQPSGAPSSISLKNGLPIPAYVSYIDTDGAHKLLVTIEPGATASLDLCSAGDYFLMGSALSGSFVGVVAVVADTTEYTFDREALLNPGEIGSPPQPHADLIIPQDSPRVFVSCGVLDTGNVVTREQYWERQADSYCLAAGETKTFSMTLTSGKQQTSSDQETFSKQVGVSASAGWGPISASVSAALSKNSTTFQQVTVTDQSTTYVSDTLPNTASHSVMYLRWQLTDVITVFKPSTMSEDLPPPSWTPEASIISGESPIIIEGPYDPRALNRPHRPAAQSGRPRELPRCVALVPPEGAAVPQVSREVVTPRRGLPLARGSRGRTGRRGSSARSMKESRSR